MLTDYIAKQMSHARYKKLTDGTYFGHIPQLRGVWGNAKTLSGCKKELHAVLEEWLVFRLTHRMNIPSWIKTGRRSSMRVASRVLA